MGMKATIENDELVVRIPLLKPPVPSESRKNLLVVNSGGKQVTEARVDGKPVTVNLTAWIPPN